MSTAGWADPTPTWPNRAGYSIPCAVMLGSGGGAARRELSRGSGACSGGERLSGSCGSLLCFLLICTIVVTVPSVCCYVKLPLSRPTSSLLVVFFFFFPFSSAPRPGEGGPRGAFVAGRN